MLDNTESLISTIKQAMRFLLLFTILFFLVTGCDRENDPGLLFEKGEYETAFNLWKPRAQNGDMDAMNYLGNSQN